jgi:hypothetical protein
MGRYDRYTRKEDLRPWKIHPIWRGIGCVLIVVLPIMAYAGATLLVQANVDNGWIRMPVEAVRTVDLPLIGSVPYLYANLALAAVMLLIGYGVVIIIYSGLFRAVGPPRYGPFDAPPPKRSRKKRDRLK